MEHDEHKFRSFSFPQQRRRTQLPDSLKRPGAEPSVSKHRRLERDIYAQESRSETIFNELSRYKFFFEQKGSSHRRPVHSNVSPRRSLLSRSVSPLRDEQHQQQDVAKEDDYVYQSPKEMIRNLNEQIDRNRGRYGSLLEFAEQNGLDVRGRVFANCEESGDVLEPKIDLENGLEEALRATSLS
ncbi:ICS2 (YBR157C) [Zygosaccharomyces parabailii]|uniref:ZYBA0S09-05006g1_1 n=1 Tax=Zygosaccharomyces bailii (strain CLIB 213 / ATCC 58445 / CBS 680 / BCRC 21525 / NBRC 1098 / NCYC 1416 / NRRL Y-2227) TaxID=1333698 RepID=A0A8J2TA79_ZYGB2|nr:ICS2 (YBR157C) [Zygosaccharomyces parabailii]CDF91110.1 ZYBA0S09-05006g1_1 [Zygosaccharomyces bailii CLIB 213]CDH14134.1 uncharacterized protein ZBAI_05920 [Zygosaccharomyces bailii ISA1307]SJM86303.1 uncharacterized protein ZBIST_2787 [Zygosaccharomyces bailii]